MQKRIEKDKLYCPRCYSVLIKRDAIKTDRNPTYIYTCSNTACQTKKLNCFWDAEGNLNHDINDKLSQEHFLLGCYYAINSSIRRITIEKRIKKYMLYDAKFLKVYIRAKSICNESATEIKGDQYKLVILYKTKIGWIQYQNGLMMLFKNMKVFKYTLSMYRKKPSYIAIKCLRSFLESNIHNDWWSHISVMIINNKYPDLKKEIDKSFKIFEERRNLKISLNK